MASITKATRNSNIELLRIIAMLAIIAHHFVVNSGVLDVMIPNIRDCRTTYLLLFGMWGKTGINCFVLITGWFMCEKSISLRKYLKLILEIWFYNIVINLIFCLTEYDGCSLRVLLRSLWPFWSVNNDFVSCYLLFYLFIPFLNILVHNMNKKQHILLLSLCIGVYSILGSIPLFGVNINYISWFIILYFIASFIKIYPHDLFNEKRFWGRATLISILLAFSSVVILEYSDVLARYIDNTNLRYYYFVSDSNKILALAVSVSVFMWFKNINIPNSSFINRVAASTFGVLLIHANSDHMRKWLWKDVVDTVGQYDATCSHLIFTSILSILAIFIICVLIDQLRVWLIERPVLQWYDDKIGNRTIPFKNIK